MKTLSKIQILNLFKALPRSQWIATLDMPIRKTEFKHVFSCKGCHVVTTAKYCENCKERALSRSYTNKRRIVEDYKAGPCTDCRRTFPPYVMHFDHLRDKLFNISHFDRHPIQDVIAEIAKCEIVCANCHAERTHKRCYDRIKLKTTTI